MYIFNLIGFAVHANTFFVVVGNIVNIVSIDVFNYCKSTVLVHFNIIY